MDFKKSFCLDLGPYTFHTEEKTRDEAQKTCELNGGNLLTITSQEEQDIIMADIDTTKQWWIGVKVDETDRSFHWADGRTGLAWSNWKKGEPNNFQEGDPCVRLAYAKSVWQWKDNLCSVTYAFICRDRYGKICFEGGYPYSKEICHIKNDFLNLH